MSRPEIKINSHSAEATQKIGERLARQLPAGSVCALIGDLAAGKTTFTRGFTRHFQVKEQVGSPTFTLINEYHGTAVIYHFDCYRIKHPEELLELGFFEYLDANAYVLIEWAELIEELLPPETIRIVFVYGENEQQREITVYNLPEGVLL
jgi:tRNA threonylcarbamoyladenosine biosynthesis protein TsaE